MKKTIAIEIISFLFIVLFVYAAVNKLIDVGKFRVQIAQSPLLAAIAPVVAWLIPIGEIGIAFLLAMQQFRLIGLYLSFGLMVMFTAYIIAILNLSTHVPCSCGGVLEKLGWTEHLYFNIGFVILGLTGIILQATTKLRKTKETDSLVIPQSRN